MQDAQQPSADCVSRSGAARGFIYVFFSLLVIYPLSIGPVAKMYSGKNVGPQWIEGIYKPIAVLAGRSELAGRFFDWYLHTVWRVKRE